MLSTVYQCASAEAIAAVRHGALIVTIMFTYTAFVGSIIVWLCNMDISKAKDVEQTFTIIDSINDRLSIATIVPSEVFIVISVYVLLVSVLVMSWFCQGALGRIARRYWWARYSQQKAIEVSGLYEANRSYVWKETRLTEEDTKVSARSRGDFGIAPPIELYSKPSGDLAMHAQAIISFNAVLAYACTLVWSASLVVSHTDYCIRFVTLASTTVAIFSASWMFLIMRCAFVQSKVRFFARDLGVCLVVSRWIIAGPMRSILWIWPCVVKSGDQNVIIYCKKMSSSPRRNEPKILGYMNHKYYGVFCSREYLDSCQDQRVAKKVHEVNIRLNASGALFLIIFSTALCLYLLNL